MGCSQQKDSAISFYSAFVREGQEGDLNHKLIQKCFIFCKQLHLELVNFESLSQPLTTSTHPSLPEMDPAATIDFHCLTELGYDHTTSGPEENTITHSESLHKLKYVIY